MFIRVMLMLMFPVLICQCSAVGGMGEIKGYLPGSVYHSVRAEVFQQCRQLCLYATQCSSVNYNPKRRLCELNSNMDNPSGQLEHRWDWIHAKMDTKTKKKKCSINTCPGSKLCVPVFNSADLCLTSLPGQKLATNNLKSLESSSALLQSSGVEAKQQVSAIDSDAMAISPSSTTLSITQKQHTDQFTTPDTGSATQTACHDLVSSSCSASETTDIQTEQLPVPSKGDYSYATGTKTISFSAVDTLLLPSASSGISTSVISSVSASSRNSISTTTSSVLATSTNNVVTTAVTNSIITTTPSASTQMTSTRQKRPKSAIKKHRASTQRLKHSPIKHGPTRERLTYSAEEKIMIKKKLSKKPKLVRCANFQLPFKEVRDICTKPNMIRRDGGECQCKTGLHYDPRQNKCVTRCRKYGTTLILQSRLMCIRGHNDKEFRSSRVEKCISACVKERKFVCRSFEYWHSKCFLSTDTRADVSRDWSPFCGCVYYQRICA